MQSVTESTPQGAGVRGNQAPFRFPNCGWEKYQGEQALVCRGYDKNAVHMTIKVLVKMLNHKVVSIGLGRFGGSAILVSNRGRGKKVIEVIVDEDGKIIFRSLR